MNSTFNFLFDVILPRKCSGCEEILKTREISICGNCLKSIKVIERSRIEHEYDLNFRSTGIITDFTSLFIFEKDKTLQHIIHNIKYNNQFNTARTLGELFGKMHNELLNSWKINLIIPVPLHHLKKAERGFNQSDFFAKGISKISRIRSSFHSIKRIRYTESQTGFNHQEREQNMADAFRIRNEKLIRGKSILLVDDIITTGATIRECGRVLLNAGAKNIFAGSIAVAD